MTIEQLNNTVAEALETELNSAMDRSIAILTQRNISILDINNLDTFDVNSAEGGTFLILANDQRLNNTDDFLVYTPPTNYEGVDSIEYTIVDSSGTTLTGTGQVELVTQADSNSINLSNTYTTLDQFGNTIGTGSSFFSKQVVGSEMQEEEVFAVNDFANTEVNTEVTINVLDNDLGFDLLLLESFEETSFQGGTVTLNGNDTPEDNTDDTLVYTPPTDFEGFDFWEYTITDEFGNTASTFVDIQVGLGINDTSNGEDPPTVTLAIDSTQGSEDEGNVFTLTATASQAVSGEQTVSLTTSGVDGDDFTGDIPSEITIADGETTGTVELTVNDDDAVEGEETATFTLESPSDGISLGANTSVDFEIEDNDGEESLQGDFNDDGITNLNDLGLFAAAFRSIQGDANYDPTIDLTGDGLINLNDLGQLATFFAEEAGL